MSSRERRLLDKDIEIRKLQRELKHYKTCFFSCVFEKDRTRKALEIAVDALKEIKDGKIPVSLGIDMDINDALEQITTLTKGGSNE